MAIVQPAWNRPPLDAGKDIEPQRLGKRGYEKYGQEKWNSLLQEAIENTCKLFNWDTLYLGGGNSKKITFKLPDNVKTVSNEDGLLGGVALWRDESIL